MAAVGVTCSQRGRLTYAAVCRHAAGERPRQVVTIRLFKDRLD